MVVCICEVSYGVWKIWIAVNGNLLILLHLVQNTWCLHLPRNHPLQSKQVDFNHFSELCFLKEMCNCNI